MKCPLSHRAALLLGTLILLLAATPTCRDDGDDDEAQTVIVKSSLGLKAELPDDVTRIELVVSGADMQPRRWMIHPEDLAADDEAVFEVRVTPGVRRFDVMCRNADDFGLYRGRRQVELVKGQVLELAIPLEAYALVTGKIVYLEGFPLNNYEENQFDPALRTDQTGNYRLESTLGSVRLEVAPNETDSSFTVVELLEAGQEVVADLVLIENQNDAQPWITSILPVIEGTTGGAEIQIWGKGFSQDENLAVVFGDPLTGVVGDISDISEDVGLRAIVPDGAEAADQVMVCWVSLAVCSNPFPWPLR